jgi:hypothetical protein
VDKAASGGGSEMDEKVFEEALQRIKLAMFRPST